MNNIGEYNNAVLSCIIQSKTAEELKSIQEKIAAANHAINEQTELIKYLEKKQVDIKAAHTKAIGQFNEQVQKLWPGANFDVGKKTIIHNFESSGGQYTFNLYPIDQHTDGITYAYNTLYHSAHFERIDMYTNKENIRFFKIVGTGHTKEQCQSLLEKWKHLFYTDDKISLRE